MIKKKYRRWSLSHSTEALELAIEDCVLSKIDENYEKEEKSNDESNLSVKSTTGFNSWSVSPDRQPPIDSTKFATPKSTDDIFKRKGAHITCDKECYKSPIRIKNLKNENFEDKGFPNKTGKNFNKIDWNISNVQVNNEELAENYLRNLGTQLFNLR